MAKKKSILSPVIFMIVITAVFTFVLAFINENTKDIIERQDKLRVEESILYVNGIDYTDDANSIESTFSENIGEETLEGISYYIYKESDTVKGYTFKFSGTGLWGTITGYIALSPDFNEILGVDFISHSETPGLGGRIDESWYKEQYRGLDVESQPFVSYTSSGGTLDAITGATLTSNSVTDMLNAFIADIKNTAKEAGLL